MDIIFGAIILGIFTILFTFLFFSSYFQQIDIRKFATVKSIMSLMIPVVFFFVYNVIPLFSYNWTKSNTEVFNRLFLIVVFMMVIATGNYIYKTKIKKSEFSNRELFIFSIISVLFMCFFGMGLNVNRSFDQVALESTKAMMSTNNIFISLLGIIITFMIVNEINKGISNYKVVGFTIRKLVKYIFVIIFAFSFIFYILMINDYCQYYISSELNVNFPTISFLSSSPSFNIVTFFDLYVSAIYFSFTTFTTIGFGDISPLSSFSRLVVILEIVCMIYIVYIGLNIALNNKEKIRKKGSSRYIKKTREFTKTRNISRIRNK